MRLNRVREGDTDGYLRVQYALQLSSGSYLDIWVQLTSTQLFVCVCLKAVSNLMIPPSRRGMDRCHVTMNISINYCADVVFIDSGMSEMVLALQIISCVASCLCLLRRMFMIGVAFVGVSQLCPFVGLSWISRSLGQTARYTSRRSPCTVDPLAFQICLD